MRNKSMHARFRQSGLTVVEVMAVVLLLLIVLGIMLPPLTTKDEARRLSVRVKSASQLRHIHDAMYTYASANGDWLPGMDDQGNPTAPTTAERFQILLQGEYFDGEYPIAPADTGKTAWEPGDPNNPNPVTLDNISYALLDISQPGERQAHWRAELNENLPLGGDRNTGGPAKDQVQSIHTGTRGHWQGMVLYADNHVDLEKSPELSLRPFNSQDPSDPKVLDHLFEAKGPDDAFWVFDAPTATPVGP